MKFWDSSALVPLFVAQAKTGAMQKLLKQDPQVYAWWGSTVECVSAVARLEREGALNAKQCTMALERLQMLSEAWAEVNPTSLVKETAVRLLRTHPLRAADSMQLAAAFHCAEGRPATLEFVSLDDRLCEAAEREGFILSI